jgi:hypothetical protein
MSERMRWGSSLSGARRAKSNARKLSDQQRKTGAKSGYDGRGSEERRAHGHRLREG